jgi:hypothetical protein
MIKYVCDRCSAMIEDSRSRYTLRVDLFAAYDILKLTGEDLSPDRDLRHEMALLIRQLEQEDPKKLTDQVYFGIEKDLCPRCRDEVQKEIEATVAGWA